jgi:ATP-dependent DNA helicase DinG
MEYVDGTAGPVSGSERAEAGGLGGISSPDVWLCASPMTAAQILSRGLWKDVSAAVCTSATLTACGSFDFFDRLSGLNRFPHRRALVVASPFDYSVQGELRIAAMKHSPKSAGFSQELCQILPTLLREHQHGQLVLFTSKRQMQACHTALPSDLLDQVQLQGQRSRTQLLKEHNRRVMNNERSIIFGLQSFGDLISNELQPPPESSAASAARTALRPPAVVGAVS